tara:strand:+ start:444 stop:884 length:441 start_codon:yes stop_codon:yes gene_type:complete
MSKENNFYKKIRKQINDWVNSNSNVSDKTVDFILMVPDFFYLLWKLSLDHRIAFEDKIKIGLLIGYFISPLDLFPELVFGPIGFLDDLIITAHLINSLMNNYKPIIFSYWSQISNQDLLKNIYDILSSIDELIGKALWNRLQNLFI